MSKRKLQKAASGFETKKQTRISKIPGFLGFVLNGQEKVEVPQRVGFVYVRLRGSTSEVIQAFNDKVSPVYGLPVLVERDQTNPARYCISGRDVGMYDNWGSVSSYLPRHGSTHSFDPENAGGDIVFVYGKQMMPLAVYPSGSSGAGNALVYPSTYYQSNAWKYAGGTGTPSLVALKPTDNQAKMVLVYLDADGNPQLSAGSAFAATITGTSAVVPYLPSVGDTSYIPLAGIRLVSGTSVILWDNIYDLRPWIIGDGFVQTGTFAPQDESYIVVSNTADLSNERQITAGNKIVFADAGANSTFTIGVQTGSFSGVIGFFYGGDLSAGTLAVRNLAPRAGTIQNVTASVYNSSTGSSIIADIHKNGVTIFTDQGNRPTILAGTTDDYYSVPDVDTFVQNDVFTLDVDQVGVSGSGANLEIQIRYSY